MLRVTGDEVERKKVAKANGPAGDRPARGR